MGPRLPYLAAALAAVVLVAGCGGDDSSSGKRASTMAVAKPEDFPQAKGRTLAALYAQYGRSGPILSPSVSSLQPGRNRFGFGLFDRARAQISDVPVALYVSRTLSGPVRGPYLARSESLAVKPQFRSRGVAADPDAAESVYVTELDFAKPGRYQVLGLARFDDRLVAATPVGGPLTVIKDDPVPEVGERPPLIHTPTKTDVAGDVSKIDTRVPPSTMQDVDFADVVGKKPIVLLFATPALCQSRVCGPVEDIAEQVKAERGDDAAFIHMEIYNDNQREKGFRPQVLRWRLPSEPYLFTLNRRGRIAAKLEGAYNAEELDRAIDAALR